MKLSKETLAIIKNFAAINSNLLLKPGNELATVSRNVFADAKVTESFPIDFGIYDTNEFLGVFGLFNDPEIEFTEKCAIFKEGSSSVKFYAADVSVLTVPTRKVALPPAEVEFVLTASQLATVQKTSAVLRAADVSFVGKDGTLSIVVSDLKNTTANAFNIDIGSSPSTFSANLKIDNIKLMTGLDYNVSISSKKLSRFVSGELTYYVALEATSNFE